MHDATGKTGGRLARRLATWNGPPTNGWSKLGTQNGTLEPRTKTCGRRGLILTHT